MTIKDIVIAIEEEQIEMTAEEIEFNLEYLWED